MAITVVSRIVDLAATTSVGRTRQWWRSVESAAQDLATALLDYNCWIEISRGCDKRGLCRALAGLLKGALCASKNSPDQTQMDFKAMRPTVAYELLRVGANLCIKHDISISDYYEKPPAEVAREYARSGYKPPRAFLDEFKCLKLLEANKHEVWRSGLVPLAFHLIESISLKTPLNATTTAVHPDIPLALPQLRILHMAFQVVVDADLHHGHFNFLGRRLLRGVALAILTLSVLAYPVLGWAWNSNLRLFSRVSTSRRIPEDVRLAQGEHQRFASDVERVESWTLRAHLVEKGIKILWNMRKNGTGILAWKGEASMLQLPPTVLPILLLPFNEINRGMDPTLRNLAPFTGISCRFVDADVNLLGECATLLSDIVQQSAEVRYMLQQPAEQVDSTCTGVDILLSFVKLTQLPPAWSGVLMGQRSSIDLVEHFGHCQAEVSRVLEVVREADGGEKSKSRRWWKSVWPFCT